MNIHNCNTLTYNIPPAYNISLTCKKINLTEYLPLDFFLSVCYNKLQESAMLKTIEAISKTFEITSIDNSR